MRASSPHADAIAPLRASARTAWRSVGQCSKPRAAVTTARAVTPASSASASSDAAVVPDTGCSAQPHGPDHSTTRRPVALALATATSPAPRASEAGQREADRPRPARRALNAPRAGHAEDAEQGHAGHEPDRPARVDPASLPGQAHEATPATTAAAPAPATRPRAKGRAASTLRRRGAPSRKGTSGAAKTTGPCHVPQRATATRPTSATAGPHSLTVPGVSTEPRAWLAVP